jgi:hypothetical protein
MVKGVKTVKEERFLPVSGTQEIVFSLIKGHCSAQDRPKVWVTWVSVNVGQVKYSW